MKTTAYAFAAILMLIQPAMPAAASDNRVLVQFPDKMREHMLANMRDHLAALNQILLHLGEGELDRAAETAEYRLGMSSLESHGAGHMAGFMPEGMRKAGSAMHQAASRFARTAQEGEAAAAYRALSEITGACVACHAGYRVQ